MTADISSAPPRFIIFSAGYNCAGYVNKHMLSINKQDYKHYVHIIVDDGSTDDTYALIQENVGPRSVVYRNTQNMGWVWNANKYLKNHIESGNDIIFIVDLDDWLPKSNVMLFVSDTYHRTNCWLTYGSFVRTTGRHTDELTASGYDSDLYGRKFMLKREYRKAPEKTWRFWAPRTFKAALWENIKEDDLKGPGGIWPKACYDRAIGYPLLEMTPTTKIQFIKEIIYVYNTDNPLNDYKVHNTESEELKEWYRTRPPYEMLPENYIETSEREFELIGQAREALAAEEDNKILIFSCGHNCAPYIKKHMLSIQKQTYKNYKHVIIDDASTDDTYLEIMDYADDKTVVIRNQFNYKWLKNAVMHLYKQIESDRDIIAIVDLDDWLPHDSVFQILNDTYKTHDCWVTYGKYVDSQSGKIWPSHGARRRVMETRNFRTSEWVYVHLQTFRAFLFKKIDPEDFKGPDGEYAPCSYDRAVMYPILEMASAEKIFYIKKGMYVYNSGNVLSVVRVIPTKQQFFERYFREKPSYSLVKKW
jgi:glycosyltransferase involved in cell wall biosynthesis